MADQTTGSLPAVQEAAIGDLPGIADLYDDTLIPVEQQGEGRHMRGAQWKAYAVAAAQGVNRGADGITPHIGENGHWYLGDTDTGVAAKGQDGATPCIGANGNWYIGDTDTGVAAQGPSGDGSGDMLASIYDPQGKATDVYQYVDDAVAAGKGVFVATYGKTTNAEIYEAYQAGKLIFVRYLDNALLPLAWFDGRFGYCFSMNVFEGEECENQACLVVQCLNSIWSNKEFRYELKGNKVTAIDAESTNDQYPTAKAVYDAIQTAITDTWEASY